MAIQKRHFRVSPTLTLPVNQEKVEYIPQSNKFEDHKHLLEQVGIAINHNLPVLLVGETGTGKTSLVRYLASKTNNGFRRVNHNGGTTVDDIVGKTLVNQNGTYWVDGVLIEAMRKGIWYLGDEINAAHPEILFAYHSLLDDDGYIVLPENGGEIVRPHPNFRFFGAINPSAEYQGTKELNKALLSRFLVVKTDFPAPYVESKILQDRVGVVKDVSDKMVKFAADIRANKGKSINFILNTRDLIMWAKMFTMYGLFMPSAEMAILNKVGDDDFDAVKDMLALNFKKIDENMKKQPGNIIESTEPPVINENIATNSEDIPF